MGDGCVIAATRTLTNGVLEEVGEASVTVGHVGPVFCQRPQDVRQGRQTLVDVGGLPESCSLYPTHA